MFHLWFLQAPLTFRQVTWAPGSNSKTWGRTHSSSSVLFTSSFLFIGGHVSFWTETSNIISWVSFPSLPHRTQEEQPLGWKNDRYGILNTKHTVPVQSCFYFMFASLHSTPWFLFDNSQVSIFGLALEPPGTLYAYILPIHMTTVLIWLKKTYYATVFTK